MQQLLAVYDDDVPKLREHVAAGEPYINYCDAQFGSALQLAVNCDDMTLDILLEAGASSWETNGFSHPEISPMDAAI